MKQRIITAIIALIVIIPFFYYGGLPFKVFAFIVAAIGLTELLRMKSLNRSFIPLLLGVSIVWIVMLGFEDDFISSIGLTKLNLITISVMLLLIYTVLSKNKFTFEDAGFIFLSAFYVGMGFYYLIEVREIGLDLLLFILFLIWATDSGAYFIGRAFGKHKLWPVISPNKTIEGAVGGVILAVITAIIFTIFNPLTITGFTLIVIAVVISITGQLGDLVQSGFKRYYNVKDSGNILPGHGGVLDRLDSMIFVMPLLMFITKFL